MVKRMRWRAKRSDKETTRKKTKHVLQQNTLTWQTKRSKVKLNKFEKSALNNSHSKLIHTQTVFQKIKSCIPFSSLDDCKKAN